MHIKSLALITIALGHSFFDCCALPPLDKTFISRVAPRAFSHLGNSWSSHRSISTMRTDVSRLESLIPISRVNCIPTIKQQHPKMGTTAEKIVDIAQEGVDMSYTGSLEPMLRNKALMEESYGLSAWWYDLKKEVPTPYHSSLNSSMERIEQIMKEMERLSLI